MVYIKSKAYKNRNQGANEELRVTLNSYLGAGMYNQNTSPAR